MWLDKDMTRRFALKVAYIGTDFYGFQRQPGLSTVEGELLKALKTLGLINGNGKCGFGIAGRTDRGVHALGNVISFLTEGEVIINQINNALPRSIRILASKSVPLQFKTRYAESRHYRYLILDEDRIINTTKMMDGAELLLGTHDFRNFSKRSERNPVRTIDMIEVRRNDNVILVDVIGESFLWNMVRKIITVLLSIGKGELEPEIITYYLEPGNNVPIKPAPAEGLILMNVNYKGIRFHYDTYAKNSFISSLFKDYKYQETIALSEREMMKSLNDL